MFSEEANFLLGWEAGEKRSITWAGRCSRGEDEGKHVAFFLISLCVVVLGALLARLLWPIFLFELVIQMFTGRSCCFKSLSADGAPAYLVFQECISQKSIFQKSRNRMLLYVFACGLVSYVTGVSRSCFTDGRAMFSGEKKINNKVWTVNSPNARVLPTAKTTKNLLDLHYVS